MRLYPVDMIADSPAMRISQASASAIPAPAAGPGSAAIVGFLTATSAPVRVRCLVRKSATRSSNAISALLALLPMPLTSPPAQKASPAPVISSAPTCESSPHCLIIRRSAGVRRSESALRASGRFSVISATRSRISHNNSLVPVSTSIRSSAIQTAPPFIDRPSHRTNSCDLQSCFGFGIKEARQPVPDEALGIDHNPIDQLLDRWDVVDQSHDHPATPGTRVHIAVDHDLGIDASDLLMDILDLELGALLTLDLDQAIDAGFPENAFGVPDSAHHQPRIELRCRNERL